MNNIIKSPIISLNVYNAKTEKSKPAKVKARPFHSLTYRKKGIVKINIGENAYISKPDCITFMPKGLDYSTEIVLDTDMVAIHFDCFEEDNTLIPFVLENTNQHLVRIFDLMLEKHSTDTPGDFECYSLFYKLLSEIEKLFKEERESKINPAIPEAKMRIEKNFADNDFNIDSLVAELPISASYLRSEFKRVYSITPIEYLQYIRLQNAISMLISDYYSIEDLAKKCGFGSSSYFIQFFSKSTGFSPRKYKENFLHNKKAL